MDARARHLGAARRALERLHHPLRSAQVDGEVTRRQPALDARVLQMNMQRRVALGARPRRCQIAARSIP
jgi:hypothetical protein